jgi:hypothetical protein
MLPHLRITAAVVGVARGAVVSPMGTCFSENFRRLCYGISALPCARRPCHCTGSSRDKPFHGARLRSGAESVSAGLQEDQSTGSDHDGERDCPDEEPD